MARKKKPILEQSAKALYDALNRPDEAGAFSWKEKTGYEAYRELFKHEIGRLDGYLNKLTDENEIQKTRVLKDIVSELQNLNKEKINAQRKDRAREIQPFTGMKAAVNLDDSGYAGSGESSAAGSDTEGPAQPEQAQSESPAIEAQSNSDKFSLLNWLAGLWNKLLIFIGLRPSNSKGGEGMQPSLDYASIRENLRNDDVLKEMARRAEMPVIMERAEQLQQALYKDDFSIKARDGDRLFGEDAIRELVERTRKDIEALKEARDVTRIGGVANHLEHILDDLEDKLKKGGDSSAGHERSGL